MPTIGYQFATSRIQVLGITLLESFPPQCIIDFGAQVFWDGHAFETEVQGEGKSISVYTTLKTPEPGPRKGQIVAGRAGLGILEPGSYIVTFFFREHKEGQEPGDYSPVHSVLLVAQDDGVITADDITEPHAWLNIMPGGAPTYHVTADVAVPSSQWQVNLVKAIPQGINSQLLLLDLVVAEDGTDPGEPAKHRVHFSEIAEGSAYDGVQIRLPNGPPLTIDNIDIVT